MQACEHPCHAPPNSLKRTSRSPSPQPRKRRPPPSYALALYADLPGGAPPLLRADQGAARTPLSLSLGAASARSSPGAGADWLQARTSELQLQTPEGRTPSLDAGVVGNEVAMEEGGTGDGEVLTDGRNGEPPDHAMQFDDPRPGAPLYAPQPAVPLSVHASASSHFAAFLPLSPTPNHAPAPHDAPPLHCHLAGSPQPWDGGAEGMARSSSGASVQSMRSMDAGGGDRCEPESPRKATGARGGGWKVTMGFRADCERCMRREQGHYTHVIWGS
ncbi:hypothetical protein JCM3770_001370 [Rhodotorula araucariae]